MPVRVGETAARSCIMCVLPAIPTVRLLLMGGGGGAGACGVLPDAAHMLRSSVQRRAAPNASAIVSTCWHAARSQDGRPVGKPVRAHLLRRHPRTCWHRRRRHAHLQIFVRKRSHMQPCAPRARALRARMRLLFKKQFIPSSVRANSLCWRTARTEKCTRYSTLMCG